jgi:hypothetical protein
MSLLIYIKGGFYYIYIQVSNFKYYINVIANMDK